VLLPYDARAMRPDESPRVSVIVPARDAAPTLERTLEALAAQQLAEPFEVIVVDDGSRDDTAAIARRHEPFVRLVQSPESQGPGAARNRGVAASRAPVLAFTDSDCFPTEQWLVRGLQSIAGVDLVQGRVEPDPGAPRTPFDRTLWVEEHGGFYQTANLFVRRETFEAAGGFRDWALERPGRRRWSVDRRRGRATRTPIGEDTLFAWTARRLGARSAFAGDALVHHAVVPGGVRDDLADRWHWTRDMPGLARLVPELREGTFHRRLFFNGSTAQFDLAVAGLLASAVSRRPWWLLAAVPYARSLTREAARYGRRGALAYALGMPVVEAATLAGLATGSVLWRCVVL
jgi:glycosyltransferase involved in cell wall biosynthesis